MSVTSEHLGVNQWDLSRRILLKVLVMTGWTTVCFLYDVRPTTYDVSLVFQRHHNALALAERRHTLDVAADGRQCHDWTVAVCRVSLAS